MWKCPKCGEQIEPQFDSCWKCAGPTPGIAKSPSAPLWGFISKLFAVGAVLFGFYYVLLLIAWWPPIPVERSKQRAFVAERIQLAGGWIALERDCDKLVDQHRDRG